MPNKLAAGDYVFVYGTLKRGLSNHHYLENNAFVGEAHSCEAFALYQGGDPWPLLVKQPHYPIDGEVYAVNAEDLRRLDELEECPALYIRERIAVILSDHRVLYAWTYFAVRVEGERLAGGCFTV